MVDFAKTLFGFGGFHRTIATSGERSTQNDEHLQQEPQQQQIESQPSSGTAQPFQHFQQMATPTTALSDNSFVYGTTTRPNAYQPQTVLSRVASDNTHAAEQASKMSSHALNEKKVTIDTNDNGLSIPSGVVAEGGAAESAPRGKLKVNIIEAKNLLTKTSNAHPYVVCTFESSEFITHGPESVDNHPAISSKRDRPIPTASRPFYSRQSSSQHLNRQNPRMMQSEQHSEKQFANSSNPAWHHETIFDVVGNHSELDISVYDSDETFLGHVRIKPTIQNNNKNDEWLSLQPRVDGERIEGEIKVSWEFNTTRKRHYGPEDFEVLRLLGKGTFGQVFQVRKLDTDRIYAMKVLSKKVIVKKKEIAHTIGERNILVRTATAASPFIVGLKFSFQTPTDLYLVTDYMSGGELFWHLQREGRFSEERAKFYIAELILCLEHLHDNGIVYRDLKPENILLDANGHIALCDFGLSKADLSTDDTTNTFCGTTEYLAPEVLLDESGYTKMVDFWSLGVLIFEMCCGWSPFYAENTQQMYKNIAFGKVRFPKEVLSAEGRSFVKGLLNRNPRHRLGSQGDARQLKEHPFFQDVDWELLRQKKIPPPFKPHLSSETDTSNFDPEFTNTSASMINKQLHNVASTPLSPGIQANFKGFTFVDESTMEDFHSKRMVQPFGSLIPGNPHLPPTEDVIEDEEEDENDHVDLDGDHEMDDDQFVNGQFDL
jgi:protein-serine/threonine kinase